MNESEFTELLLSYSEQFGEAYPIYAKPSNWGDEEIVKDVRQCIETKTPSKAIYDKDKEY